MIKFQARAVSVFAAAALSASLAACATAPEDISPAYVSPLQYSVYGCEQIRMELFRVSSRVREVSGMQRRGRNADTAAVVVTALIFPPAALFASRGGGHEEEIANLKGQYDALSIAAVEKNCPVVEELNAAGAAPARPN